MELTKCFRCFMPEIFEIIDNCLLLHSQKYPFYGGEGADEVGDAIEAISASGGIDISWKFNATRSRYKGSHAGHAGQDERNRL